MAARMGSDDYREGALARLGDARILIEQERWVGAVYLAGRAVEAFLRSLLCLRSRELEVGHDLRMLLRRAGSLGILRGHESQLRGHINDLAIVWHNNLRFVGDGRFSRDLASSGRDKRVGGRRVKGDASKANAKHTLETCQAIMTRGEVIWKRYSKK